MASKKSNGNKIKTIKQFFTYLQKIHSGDMDAIPKMLKLWNEDGVVTLIGVQPYSGEFKGINAIQVLYTNVARSAGMQVDLGGGKSRVMTLGPRKFVVESIESVGEKVIATWQTTISTKEGVGFTLSGGDTFTFAGEKIHRDACIMSSKAQEAKGLQMADLAIKDIGRLALAAWAVV